MRMKRLLIGGCAIACVGIVTIQVLRSHPTRRDEMSGPKLQGQMYFDFGEHVLDGPTELDHSFVLTNASEVPVKINRIATTCGCTRASPSENTVLPGGSVSISVTLRLNASGRRSEQVRVVYDDAEPLVLVVEATARVPDAFYCAQAAVRLDPGRAARVLAVQLRRADDAPASLKIEAPSGIRATAGEWMKVVSADQQTQSPSRWHAWIEIETFHDSTPADRVMTIIDSLGRRQRIGLNGLPAG